MGEDFLGWGFRYNYQEFKADNMVIYKEILKFLKIDDFNPHIKIINRNSNLIKGKYKIAQLLFPDIFKVLRLKYKKEVKKLGKLINKDLLRIWNYNIDNLK